MAVWVADHSIQYCSPLIRLAGVLGSDSLHLKGVGLISVSHNKVTQSVSEHFKCLCSRADIDTACIESLLIIDIEEGTIYIDSYAN